MSRTLLRRAAFLVLAVAFTGCRDQLPEPLAPGAIARTHLPSDAPITTLINQLFGPTANSTTVQWGKVLTALETGNAADTRDKLLKVADFIRSHTHLITPAANETQQEAAARLINLMVAYVFGNSGMGSDAVVAFINPASDTVVHSPDRHAAIQLPAGAFSEPTVLLIYRDPVQTRPPCAGPLDTTLCQYPLFYHFDPYPHARLNVPARIGVCHVNSGPGAVPVEIHDRLRLAHDAPDDPAGYVDGGTVVEGIEILPYADVSDFLVCGTTTLASAITRAPSGSSLADRGLRALTRLASAAAAFVAPTTAHAIDQGGGGFLLEFSNFNAVDPGEDEDPADTTPPVITPDVTGTLGDNGWYTSDVNVSWNVTDDESAITSPACASSSLTVDTPGQTFTCTATSAGGTSTGSVIIKRDATSPVIGYTGNQGSYTVAETVAITCSASDAMSGLASDTCGNVSGDAYTFGLGNHSYSATASDNAGNTSSASTSFDVRVTPESLCTLTRRFSSSAGIGNSLCAKLGAYAASITRGSSVSAAGQLRAYINEVRAQSGKAIPADKATILISLAMAL